MTPYIDIGLSVHASNPAAEAHGFRYWYYDANKTANPYCTVAAGIQLDPVTLRSISATISLFVRHESSIATGKDYGTNSAGFLIHFTTR